VPAHHVHHEADDRLHRIELREQAGESLPDVDAFDLAWIPSLFVPERAIDQVIARVARALLPGGWLLFAVMRPTADPLTAALARLRTRLFGGLVTTPEAASTMLSRSGLHEMMILPAAPTSVVAIVARGASDRPWCREAGRTRAPRIGFFARRDRVPSSR
jgi:SAM-dependent methyltransferase